MAPPATVRPPRSIGRARTHAPRGPSARLSSSSSRLATADSEPTSVSSGPEAMRAGLRFLALHDVSFSIEVEHDRRHIEVRPDLLCHPVLSPVLVLGAGSVEPQHDQISVEL